MSKWDPSGHPAYLLGRAARLFEWRTQDRLKKIGISNAHIPVLRALEDGGAKSQTALAQLARIEQPTMAQMLARMERDKLVHRVPNPEDGRSSLYSLTKSALAKVTDARKALEKSGTELLATLTATEHAQLTAILGKVVTHMEDLD